MFFSSDASGEIYVVMKDETANGTTGGSASGGSNSSGGKPKSGAQSERVLNTGALLLSVLACYIVS